MTPTHSPILIPETVEIIHHLNHVSWHFVPCMFLVFGLAAMARAHKPSGSIHRLLRDFGHHLGQNAPNKLDDFLSLRLERLGEDVFFPRRNSSSLKGARDGSGK